MKTVEIFRTDVNDGSNAEKIITFFLAIYPNYKINFDLEDCENILRFETNKQKVESEEIINYMVKLGHVCERII